MNRRLPHTPTAPRLDSAPDADDLYPCTADRLERQAKARLNGTPVEPTPHDVLTDIISGPAHERAIDEAKKLCGRCLIQTSCLAKNAKAGEPWARTLLGLNRTDPAPPRSTVSPERTARQKQRDKLRRDTLTAILERGDGLEVALTWLGMTPKGLYSWCRRQRALDIWRRLTAADDRQPNRHARGAA